MVKKLLLKETWMIVNLKNKRNGNQKKKVEMTQKIEKKSKSQTRTVKS